MKTWIRDNEFLLCAAITIAIVATGLILIVFLG